jgi:Ca2+-binding RTX toxin-like protein
VSDTLPPGLDFVSASATGVGIPPICSQRAGTVFCSPSVYSDTIPFVMTIKVIPTQCGTFTNTATFVGLPLSVSERFTVEGCPTLSVSHEGANANGWNNTSPVALDVSASDSDSGLAGPPTCKDGDTALALTAGTTAGTWTASVSGEGTHAIECSVSDEAGNTTNASDTVKIDTTSPSVTIDQASGQADPTSSSPIHFTAVFDEPVTGFEGSDVTLSGTAGATTAVVTEIDPPNDGTTYDVAVSGMTSDGTVTASIPADAAQDAAQNGNTPSTSTDNEVVFDAPNIAPTVSVAAGGECGTNDRSGTINLTVSDPDNPVAGLTLSADSVNKTLVPNANVTFGGSGAARTLTTTAVSGRTGTAVLKVTVSDGAATGNVDITVVVDGNGSKTITGTSGADIIFGKNGNDTIDALGGNDLLCGGNGVGTMSGGFGDDTIDGANGDDVLLGGIGKDILRGGFGNDRLTGGDEADFFSGGAGTDTATDFNAAAGDTKDATIP